MRRSRVDYSPTLVCLKDRTDTRGFSITINGFQQSIYLWKNRHLSKFDWFKGSPVAEREIARSI
ncbi:MAG TPA: hypothetical protein VF691_07650 [Cytophagaceae bacterium]